jgi:uncharacterized SAM-binding protein YcdF (DUF218 family)
VLSTDEAYSTELLKSLGKAGGWTSTGVSPIEGKRLLLNAGVPVLAFIALLRLWILFAL